MYVWNSLFVCAWDASAVVDVGTRIVVGLLFAQAEAHTGCKLTESLAMWPASSVSALVFAHPQSRYFALDKICKDQVCWRVQALGCALCLAVLTAVTALYIHQVAEYADRKGAAFEETEKWLQPTLGYDA